MASRHDSRGCPRAWRIERPPPEEETAGSSPASSTLGPQSLIVAIFAAIRRASGFLAHELRRSVALSPALLVDSRVASASRELCFRCDAGRTRAPKTSGLSISPQGCSGVPQLCFSRGRCAKALSPAVSMPA